MSNILSSLTTCASSVELNFGPHHSLGILQNARIKKNKKEKARKGQTSETMLLSLILGNQHSESINFKTPLCEKQTVPE